MPSAVPLPSPPFLYFSIPPFIFPCLAPRPRYFASVNRSRSRGSRPKIVRPVRFGNVTKINLPGEGLEESRKGTREHIAIKSCFEVRSYSFKI